MSSLLPFFWTIVWAFLSQVLLFRYGIFWGGYGLLAVHIYGLLKMPVGWPPTTYLILTALMGAMMDVACFTGGMHLAASTTFGMVYPAITSTIPSREGLRQGHVLNPHYDGWSNYAAFASLGLAVYWGVLFSLQNGWPLVGRTLGQTALSALLNVAAFLLIQGLLNRPSQGNQRNVSAYPWS